MRVLVRGHLKVQKELAGADRMDGGRMVGGMAKVRGVVEPVAVGIRTAVRATGDAVRRLAGMER